MSQSHKYHGIGSDTLRPLFGGNELSRRRSLRSNGGTHDDSAATIDSLCEDFRQLVSMFDQHIRRLSDSNSETVSGLGKARAGAERGLRLSERLARAVRINRKS